MGQLRTDLLRRAVEGTPLRRVVGRVVQVVGPVITAELPGATVGALCYVAGKPCEIVGFTGHRALLIALDDGAVTYGAPVELSQDVLRVGVGDALIGRVLDGLGRPIDGLPPPEVTARRSVHAEAPDPMSRSVISEPLETGVRAIDGLNTLGKGQRITITAGSGVGKSTLLGMLARHVKADVNVVCLVGERGREVREFIERSMGDAGLSRSVLVVATSDRSPSVQIKAAMTATTIAEAFRDEGRDVLLMMDSLTRLAHAQRQVGLAAGEPPTTRGYTPSVFALLPTLLERAGPGAGRGSITGIYTVLVEADDHNDPIADAARGIVDGHLVLSRSLANRGHFPAIDILQSLSRLMPHLVSDEAGTAARTLRERMAVWKDNADLVRLGAYRKGTSPEIDRAIESQPAIERFLQQRSSDPASLPGALEAVRAIVS
jgi:flagellum-specific ATP synthase